MVLSKMAQTQPDLNRDIPVVWFIAVDQKIWGFLYTMLECIGVPFMGTMKIIAQDELSHD